MASEPRVGVAVFVFQNTQDGHFVVGRRKGSHGAGTTAVNPHLSSVLTFIGTYALPGGHLDFGESFEQCAAREVKEETGLDVQDVRFLTATNTVFGDTGKHYVTIFMTAMVVANLDGSVAEPQRLEPDKCEGWSWCTFAELRKMPAQNKKLFAPLHSLMEQRPDVCTSLEAPAKAEANRDLAHRS